MAKGKNGTTKKVDTEKTTEKKPVEKKFKHKVKTEKECGFKSRNYYINNKNVLLVAGKGIEEADYDCFSNAAKEKYFTNF